METKTDDHSQLDHTPRTLSRVLELSILSSLCSRWDWTAPTNSPTVVRRTWPSPTRYLLLTIIDGLIADIIDRIPSSSKYTLLYVTSPREFPEIDSVVYESEDAYPESVRMELKRDYSAHSTYSSASEADRKPSLFDEYQFFTPGLYSPLVNCPRDLTRLTHWQEFSWASWLLSYA